MSHTLIYPTQNIEKVMRKPVVTIRPDQSLHNAAELMQKKGIGSVVVVEDGKPTGIITERDFVRLVAKKLPSNTSVREAMMTPVITCESERKVTEAFVMMAVNKIDHLPITKKKKLVGIVTTRDLMVTTFI